MRRGRFMTALLGLFGFLSLPDKVQAEKPKPRRSKSGKSQGSTPRRPDMVCPTCQELGLKSFSIQADPKYFMKPKSESYFDENGNYRPGVYLEPTLYKCSEGHTFDDPRWEAPPSFAIPPEHPAED